MDETLCATESRPSGKIIFAVSVSICFQRREEGLPPNTWANKFEELMHTRPITKKFFIRIY
jgi:hypothetical protein